MPTVEVLFTEEEELLLLTVEAADNVFTVIKPAITTDQCYCTSNPTQSGTSSAY
jgi:hypothetical protein